MWCFAIVNNRLAEIYFEKHSNQVEIYAHCYVLRSEFTTKEELKQIDDDIKNVKISYRKGKYRLLPKNNIWTIPELAKKAKVRGESSTDDKVVYE